MCEDAYGDCVAVCGDHGLSVKLTVGLERWSNEM